MQICVKAVIHILSSSHLTSSHKKVYVSRKVFKVSFKVRPTPYETSMQITHQTRKCWNESLQNIIKYNEDNTNIGADALPDIIHFIYERNGNSLKL